MGNAVSHGSRPHDRDFSAHDVTPFGAAVAIPRGFVAAADVIGVILFVGGAWVVVDRLGVLAAVIGALVHAFRRSGLLAIPMIAAFFGVMGALENMQEEIIPLVPVLLVMGAGLGIDAVSIVAASHSTSRRDQPPRSMSGLRCTSWFRMPCAAGQPGTS